MKGFPFFFVLFFLFTHKVSTYAKEDLISSQFYFLIDADTKEVLLAKNADVRIAPSSMTKIMTAYVVFDQITKGKISLDSQCLVGKDAWRKSGSSMFLNYGDLVSIEKLIKGLLVVSGNDAAVALAESTGNGIDNFISLMNLKAEELGLQNSHFKNPHGLSEDGHYMSLRDLATLTTRIYQDFPQYLHYFGISEFTYHNIRQRNRNPLIKSHYDGIIGGKTGYTNAGGYGVVSVVKRNHRRLVGVVNKTRTPKQRKIIITNLFDYGFQGYKKLILFEKNKPIAKLKTWLGSESEVSVASNQKIAFNIPRNKHIDDIKVRLKYKGPIYAPITTGTKLASLIIDVKGYKVFEYSLFAQERIDKVGYLGRMKQVLRYKIRSFLNKFFS